MRPQASTEIKASSPLTLSPEDVDRLLHDNTPQTRVDMTNKIAGAYSEKQLSDREAMVGEQVFRLLLRDTELRVRVSLAQHLKESAHIPRDIILTLARDVEEVSLPVLQSSQVLTDDDLLDLINATEQVSRYLAISKRSKVSGVVSATLVDKGNGEVAQSLIDNKGAEIPETALEKIVNVYAKNDAMMEALHNRPNLPITVVDKMMAVVSATFADTLKKKHKVPTEQIDREVDKTREKETLNLIKLAVADQDIDKLVSQLHASDRLTPALILSSLCQGNFEFFETGLAKLSNLPVANARALIHDEGELGFKAIYNKSGLPEAMFPAVKLLLKIVKDLGEEGEKIGSPRYANRIVERILQHSEDTQMDNLSYIIALVRRIAQ